MPKIPTFEIYDNDTRLRYKNRIFFQKLNKYLVKRRLLCVISHLILAYLKAGLKIWVDIMLWEYKQQN